MLPLVFTLLSFASAHADWEANFSAISSKDSSPKAAGKFYSKVDQFRVDATAPFELNLYVKAGSTHAYAAVPSFHIRLSTNLEQALAQIPVCLSHTFEECAKIYSLKKTGEENCGEGSEAKTCEVFTGDGRGMRGVKKIVIRHWKGEKEPILASGVVTKSDGEVITAKFTKIARKSRDVSFFAVPDRYMNAGSLEKFFGDFKGKPE